ncbi:Hpt domain-containing protein [Bythopirellula goksoeyrii]|uniref:Hpt domain protein n=1 Tax=Bythopirellula goksoeyrii TaxID=1400387 RepID=A0A5B9QCX9_9BACT|nr:Hpt domain-containing protein [Bythopirellula goksoeyrii]QEG36917.1 Hpt domain protein [Bythopirellula goksoeyrii]
MKSTYEASSVKQQHRTDMPDYDLNAALERLGGSRELLRDMIGFYLEDYTILLDRIEDAAEAGDPISLARSAHSLKGLASNFDATEVIEASDATTLAARKSVGLMPEKEIAALSHAASELAEHLQAELDDGEISE